jgi:chromosome segregation ATPase
MSNDNFSQKEILLQLISKVDNLADTLNKQELLLNTIHEASANRDEKIKDLKDQVIILEEEVKTLTHKVEALKSFNKTIVAIWSGFILLVSMFGKDLINRFF